mmetsp:Transcript_16282/g.23945  ORF Transcript_16282/g.23945 Transcript_16282/m.23945 type:complete len:264 (+) Transcript_16282:86-877(+)
MQRSTGFQILFFIALLIISNLQASNVEDELLKELLEEERRVEEERMKESGYQFSEEHIRQGQEEMEKEKKRQHQQASDEEERLVELQNERIREQREAEFEASVARMNEDQQKAARKQRKKDSQIVKKILQASERGNHYSVLGLLSVALKIGPFTFVRPSPQEIKKAYRNRAKKTHPDKNRDGRAQQAFVAVEESAAVLMDEEAREQFDLEIKMARKEKQEMVLQKISTVRNFVKKQLSWLIWLFQKVLGPFAFPIFILGCLLI